MSGCDQYVGSGSKLTYAELEAAWIHGGGSPALAPMAAAIAEAESGGQSNVVNTCDNGGTQSSYGLWQVSTGTHAAPSSTWSNPVENARLAVGKYNGSLQASGNGWLPWGTYQSGAYRAFLSNSTPPATSIPGGTSGLSTATLAASSASNCLVRLPFGVCLLTKSQGKGILGGLVLTAGSGVTLVGLILLAAYGLNSAKARAAASAMRKVSGTGSSRQSSPPARSPKKSPAKSSEKSPDKSSEESPATAPAPSARTASEVETVGVPVDV